MRLKCGLIGQVLMTLWIPCCLGLLAGESNAETRVGVAQVDITPPLGTPMAGYYHERGADGVLDPLYCRAMVIQRDETQVACVVLDLISVTRSITDEARQKLQATGIPGDHVMICATHTHTGPELAHRGHRYDELGGRNQQSIEYTASIPDRIAQTVRQAHDQLTPARLSIAHRYCQELAYNRRYFMRDGTVGWNPGKLNSDIVLPAGPSDPEVGILYVEQPDARGPSQSIATFVNFAMHPDTTGGSRFSADWPCALARTLSSYHGPDHVTMLGNGTCGNLNNYDFFWKWPNNGPGEQNRIATILGASIFQAYKDLASIDEGPIQAQTRTVELALPEITAQQVEEARKAVAATKDDRGSNFMTLVRSYRALDVAQREGKPHQVELQAISIGNDVAWISLPGEVFVELGLAIKKRSPFSLTFVVELANENIGYIPDRRSYAEGNYEPESARCAAGSGEKLVDVAAEMLEQLHAGS